MRKGIFLSFLILSSQLYGYQHINDNTIVFSDLLLWKLREGSADDWAQQISDPGVVQTAKLLEVPFRWNAGFRVGVGRRSCNHLWEGILSYTRYQTTGLQVANAPSGGLYSPFLGNFFANNTDGSGFGPNYKNAGIKWKLSFNTFDLTLGRRIKIDPILILRPSIGLKAAIINHHIGSNWETPTIPTTFTTATENLKNDFWGIGPSLGLDTLWPIYQTSACAFNLFGNFSGSLLAGRWRFSEQYENNTPTSVQVLVSDVNGGAPMATALIGFAWARHFSSANLNIRLGYEAQVWFNQLQYYSLAMGRLNHLMSLQGGVLDFYVNF